jgi:hypothetical protein
MYRKTGLIWQQDDDKICLEPNSVIIRVRKWYEDRVPSKAGEMKISGRDGNEKFSNIFGTGIGTGTA